MTNSFKCAIRWRACQVSGLRGLGLILACFLLLGGPALAQGMNSQNITGIQVSLFHPLQAYPDNYSVDGLRWNFIYGVNKDLQGIDIGLVNVSLGDVQALEIGGFNAVQRDFQGLQIGLIANTTRSCEGVQVALFYNNAQEEMHGLQIGLVNHTGSLEGIQLGLLNFNDTTKYLGFFPFINAAF